MFRKAQQPRTVVGLATKTLEYRISSEQSREHTLYNFGVNRSVVNSIYETFISDTLAGEEMTRLHGEKEKVNVRLYSRLSPLRSFHTFYGHGF